MKITILSVGKIKEQYIKEGIQEYSKRLRKYAKVDIIEVEDEKAPENLSAAQMEQVKEKEGERLLKQIPKDAFVIVLAIEGAMVSSEQFATFIEQKATMGFGHLCFVIGGSLGLAPALVQMAQYKLSFSKMTFPHQLMRLILLEQVYRGFRILKGEPYHK